VGLHTLGVGIRRGGRYLAFIPLYFIANVTPFVTHAYIVHSVGHWEESSVGFADRTRSPPYAQFLDQLLSLADAMLTRELVYLIGAWFVLLIGRLFLRKLRHRDLIAVSFLFSVGLYAHVFTSGFFVHAYRILYANVVSAI